MTLDNQDLSRIVTDIIKEGRINYEKDNFMTVISNGILNFKSKHESELYQNQKTRTIESILPENNPKLRAYLSGFVNSYIGSLNTNDKILLEGAIPKIYNPTQISRMYINELVEGIKKGKQTYQKITKK